MTQPAGVDTSNDYMHEHCGKCGHVRHEHHMGLSENLVCSGGCRLCDCGLFLSEAFMKQPKTLDNHHNALTCPQCNPKGYVLVDAPEYHQLSAALAACHEERDLQADGLNEAGAALTMALNQARWQPESFTPEWFIAHYDAYLDRLVNHPNLPKFKAAEQQLAALTEERDRLVKEMEEVTCVVGGSSDTVGARGIGAASQAVSIAGATNADGPRRDGVDWIHDELVDLGVRYSDGELSDKAFVQAVLARASEERAAILKRAEGAEADLAALRSGLEEIAKRGCRDARGSEGWTCREFDGTGLWCDPCLAAETLSRVQPT